jgi:hypothetical protein
VTRQASHTEQFRDELLAALKRELVGPDLPPHGTTIPPGQTYVEELEEAPTQRYSAGVLFPQSQVLNEIELGDVEPLEAPDDEPGALLEDEAPAEVKRSAGAADAMADAYDETVRLANEFLPSAAGLSFLCEFPEEGLTVKTCAARYESFNPADEGASRFARWRRVELDLPDWNFNPPRDKRRGIAGPLALTDHLELRALYRQRQDGVWLVTVTLVSTHRAPEGGRVRAADCFFQVGIRVEGPQGQAVFPEYEHRGRSADARGATEDKLEEASLELLYRHRRAYAVGHGVSVDWGKEVDGRVAWVATEAVPHVKVPPVDPLSEGGDETSMYCLSGAEGEVAAEAIPGMLERVADSYEQWVNSLDLGGVSEHLQDAANHNLGQCRRCISRVREGIRLLRDDETVLEAFMLANRAVLMQQVHARLPKRGIKQPPNPLPDSYRPDDPAKGRWRTFQLVFLLMNLQSISQNADGNDHPDRDLVDLIWFPTGGGKTEAYLGLAAADIFYRRLKRPDNTGCTVLMRYTLRLLTAQQFQRASSLICACELERRNQPDRLGEAPITIGLWVGESLTPIKRQDALKSLNSMCSKGGQEANPFQLLKCPWCGTALDDQEELGYRPAGRPKSVAFICPNDGCQFKTPKTRLPVLVIDEDVYDTPPTLLIGTVDKFAMLAWRDQAGRLFGIGTEGDCDPPDLVIQDELHLISGPLGSVVGLYETAIDLLCSRKGRRPKIVASTATIRRAWRQCKSLYDRESFQFPPQALDISDSYFARENPSAPGRIYAGVFATAAPSFVTALVRTIGGLFQSCGSLPLPDGAEEPTRDPYWTILQYFSSLRELGHAATLVEADIPEYMWSIATRTRLPRELCRSLGAPVEMTSRRTADEIPEILERLEVSHPRTSKDGKDRPLDTLLATNMISVGVDVDRLGLMVVVGQPKTTSEYIQASSRVGRSQKAPGLVVAMYNPGKPRDRSHYEQFRAYHEAFYRHVEPTSVTPFSLPVAERALHALLVVLTRHLAGTRTPDELPDRMLETNELVEAIVDRCRNVDPEHTDQIERRLRKRIAQWTSVLPKEWGRFGPPPESRPLMYPAGSEPLDEWQGSAWSTPSSMRNVDVECEAQVLPSYEVSEPVTEDA